MRKIGPRCPYDLGSVRGNLGSPLPAAPCSLQTDPLLCSSPEKIDVLPVEAHAVFLGIHGGKLCLSCVKAGDEIRLQLEVRTCPDSNLPTFFLQFWGPTTTSWALLLHVGNWGCSCCCSQRAQLSLLCLDGSSWSPRVQWSASASLQHGCWLTRGIIPQTQALIKRVLRKSGTYR